MIERHETNVKIVLTIFLILCFWFTRLFGKSICSTNFITAVLRHRCRSGIFPHQVFPKRFWSDLDLKNETMKVLMNLAYTQRKPEGMYT